MDRIKNSLFVVFLIFLSGLGACKEDSVAPPAPDKGDFLFGVDLSYVNQILDYGGVYRQSGAVVSPYKIFRQQGANVVRLRLWHNPVWTQEVYGDAGTQLYNDFADVEKAIVLAKEQGLQVLLDFHYSDTWADPGSQQIPAAWLGIKNIAVLRDSVYNYTFNVLTKLKSKSLLPEFVQLGNETNCGLLYTDAPTGFPSCNGCNGEWANLRSVLKAGIAAARAVGGDQIKIALHVADPKNVDWWFTNVVNNDEVSDFDIIGFSYYPLWHTTVPVSQLSNSVAGFKNKFNKDVMILETAYPWTTDGNDNYTNIFGGQTPLAGFPFSNQGQLDMLTTLTQEVLDGGGIGIVYWEPAWITSDMRDLWGKGSAWENNAFFGFDGEVNSGMQFMTRDYNF